MATSKDSDIGPPPEFEAAFKLVGQFMWHWAALEAELNRSLRTLLGLGALEAIVVTANMGVRDKIHTVRTLVNLHGPGDPDWRARANKTIELIAGISEQRNVVAHTFFAPHKKGGVEFLTVKAKGALAVPNVVWGLKTFERHEGDMNRLSKDLAVIVARITASREVAEAAPQNAMFGIGPTPGFGRLTPQPGLMTQPRPPQSFPKATREKAPRKLRERKPKRAKKKPE